MKRIIFLFALLLNVIVVSAQEEYFTCPEYKADIQDYNKTTKGSNKKRCQMLKDLNHMNDDGEIQYQYVFKAKDTLNREQLMNIIRSWAKTNYNNYEKSLVSETDSTIEFKGLLLNIGQVMGAFKTAIVNAESYVRIETKSNRIRVTATVRHYTLAGAGLSGVKSTVTLPRDVYPYTDSDNQSAYAQAYINSHFALITNIGSIFLYLNKNYPNHSEKEKKNDDW